MPNTRRWSVSPRRVVFSAVLAAIALFLVFGAIGEGSWLTAAVGLAMLAGSVGLFSLSALNSRAYSYIPGTARVLGVSEPPLGVPSGRCHLHLEVHAKNIPGIAVKTRDPGLVLVAKWPAVGTVLPIEVAVDDPRRVRVLWDAVPARRRAADPAKQSRVPPASGTETDEYDDGGDYGDGDYSGGGGGDYSDGDYGSDSIDVDGTGGLDDEDGYRPDGPFDQEGPDDELDRVGVTEVPGGRRVIELDVMDPSLVRWSGTRPGTTGSSDDPSAAAAATTPAATTPADAPTTGMSTARRRPSPRPRPPAQEPPRPPAQETIVSISFADPVASTVGEIADDSTVPLRVHQARVGDEPFDPDGEAPALADAYLAATPPPGAARPGRIRSVAVTLLVTDLSRSIIFYRDLLGFQEIDAGHGSAVLESGEARIVLRRVNMAPVERRLVQLLLEVPDVSAAYQDLRTRGVSFIHQPRPVSQYEQMELWSAAFRDPDGHGIAVTHWQPKR